MSIQDQPPKLINLNWLQWAQRTSAWLATTRSSLRHRGTGESAAEDGVLLWDRETGYPVISKSGGFKQISLLENLKSPVFSYTNGLLTQVQYRNNAGAVTATKTLSYTNSALTQMVMSSAQGTITKAFNYTSGVLTSITET